MENNPDSDYTLFVKALLKKDLETLNIDAFSQNQKQEIEKCANIFFERNMIMESLQTFFLLKQTNKLNELGNLLLKNKQNEFAYEAFKLSKNQENLTKVGEAFLSNAEIEKAYLAFKLANNAQMIEFIETNFERKFKQ